MAKLTDLLNHKDLGKIQTMKSHPPFKTERQHIQQELNEADEDSVSDTDEKQAKRLKKPLTNAIAEIARSIDNINKALSDFNSPGLKHAFIDAIKIGVKHQGKFDERAAYKRFEEYFKGR
jgi:TATA-binding protein-associated factor Taf7|tara:strand:+ start:480 stop:839 length:360 start_codon:yes stop_codon:yes gene_type:complete